MNPQIYSLQPLADRDYMHLGKSLKLLTKIEFEVYRTYALAIEEPAETILKKAARGTLKQRTKLLEDALKKDNQIPSDFKRSLIEKLYTVDGYRSQFFHGVWMRDDTELTSTYYRRNSNKGLDKVTVSLTEEKFDQFYLSFETMLKSLHELQIHFQESHGKSET